MAEDFLSQMAVPEAQLGIYLHLHNCAPIAVIADATQTLNRLRALEESPVIRRAFALPRTDFDAFQAFREQLRLKLILAQRAADTEECGVVAAAMLWLVLHMPGHGPDFCRQARDGLVRDKRYIFTVACSQRIAYMVTGGSGIPSLRTIGEHLARADRSTEHRVVRNR